LNFEALNASSSEWLLSFVKRFSLGNGLPWSVKTWRKGEQFVNESIMSALTRVGARELDAAYISRRVDHVTEEVINPVPNAYRTFLDLPLALAVDLRLWEEAFVALAEHLNPPYLPFIPRFDDEAKFQEAIIEMALQRDFAMYGFDQTGLDVRIAKAMAPLFPRLQFEAPRPYGLPVRLGWLNWWPGKVARELGYPDATKDEWLEPLSYRLPSGAWLVKLTKEPLDLTRQDHVEALARAYWRFAKIGKRMRPVAPKAVKKKPLKDGSSARGDKALSTYVIRERDENGNWWVGAHDPIAAASPDDALRKFFAKCAHSREPVPGESLAELRKAYDMVAAEVGMIRSDDIDAIGSE
jgi:hypothetical protein